MKKITISIVLLVLYAGITLAQENPVKRTVGLTASVQGGQLGIMVPLWLSSNFTLAPAVDVVFTETVGTDLSVGLVPKYYFKTTGLAPFINVKFGTIFYFPSDDNTVDDESQMDILAGIGFGAEYFFNDHFSIGVEAQGNVTFSDEDSYRFGNPDGTNFNTATAVTANVYF